MEEQQISTEGELRELEETYMCGNDFRDGNFSRTDSSSECMGAKFAAQCTFHFGRVEQSARPEIWARRFDIGICYRLAWPAWFEVRPRWRAVRSRSRERWFHRQCDSWLRSACPATRGAILRRSIGAHF